MALLLAALIAAAAAPPPPSAPLVVERQALTTVHILRPATIRLGDGSSGGNSPPIRARDVQLRGADGLVRPARLIEFP